MSVGKRQEESRISGQRRDCSTVCKIISAGTGPGSLQQWHWMGGHTAAKDGGKQGMGEGGANGELSMPYGSSCETVQ